MKFTFFVVFSIIASEAFCQVKHPSLFRISAPGRTKDSVVFGTIHGQVSLDEFPIDITQLVAKARVVLAEVSLTAEEVSRYTLDPFSVIADHSPISASDLDGVTGSKLAQLGFPQYFIDQTADRDCGVISLLGQLRSRVWALDLEVIKIARLNDVNVIALDTPELRVEARTRNNAVEGTCSLKAMLELYSPEQIVKAIDTEIVTAASSYRDRDRYPIDPSLFNSPIVTFRNHAWMTTIDAELKKGNAFIAVGEAHLYGDQGVLNLMTRLGYSVSEIRQ